MDDKQNQAQVDESYWKALLNDSEIADGFPPESERASFIKRFDFDWEGEDDSVEGEVWRLAQQALESGEIQEVQVVGYNRGGVLIEWKGLRGFVPASHLVCLSPFLDAEARYAELARQVGNTLAVRIIEVDRAQDRFVLSERVTVFGEDRTMTLWAELAPDQVREGVVTNVCSFGAFVDLGGVEGLIHVSEISWGRVGQPGDVLESGQTVNVYVISVDSEQKRVALSLKRLQPDPWATVEERYRVGQLIEGEVTNVVNFGAFVRVEDGLEGLIHVSELAEGTFLHPRNVVNEGDVVVASILNIDGVRRRMGLSLRRRGGAILPLKSRPASSDYREMLL